jgi:hypothetical protein
MTARIDITGQRYGRLVALERVASRKRGQAMWMFRCDCGVEKEIRLGNVRSGRTRSCGCWQRCRVRFRKRDAAPEPSEENNKPAKSLRQKLEEAGIEVLPSEHPTREVFTEESLRTMGFKLGQ